MIIGVTGQTGAGKTTLLRWLEARGFAVVDCDEVYHALFEHDEALRSAIMSEFGTLERRRLANIVFSDHERLKKLNELTHPAVLNEVKRIISGKKNAAIDAVELFEGGEAALCDRIIAVTAPREARIERIMLRDGIDRAYAEARVDGQKTEAWYRSKCGLVIENNFGSEAEFSAFLDNEFGKETDI
ncbi:MAG: dephospho-CoA kinase, partial [Oscillospiraceae bacterium]|nr:dephospho-CoA kinase [Oscillospiraceae bacterium]